MFVPTAQGSHWISWAIDNTGKVAFENPQYPGINIEKWLGMFKYARNMSQSQLTGIRLDNLDIDNTRIGEVVNIGEKAANLFNTSIFSGNNFVMTDIGLKDFMQTRL